MANIVKTSEIISSLLDYFAASAIKKGGGRVFREFRAFKALKDLKALKAPKAPKDLKALKAPKDPRNLKKLQGNYQRVHCARRKIPKQALYFARLFVPLR